MRVRPPTDRLYHRRSCGLTGTAIPSITSYISRMDYKQCYGLLATMYLLLLHAFCHGARRSRHTISYLLTAHQVNWLVSVQMKASESATYNSVGNSNFTCDLVSSWCPALKEQVPECEGVGIYEYGLSLMTSDDVTDRLGLNIAHQPHFP
jgi:hypothetical protein